MLARAVVKGVNVRSSPDSQSTGNILAQLARDEQVTLVAPYKHAPKWWKVSWNGQTAYVARRLVTPVACAAPVSLDPAIETLVNDAIIKASAAYDEITYGLGCKCERNAEGKLDFSTGLDFDRKPCKGARVDCSGWIAGLAQLIFGEIDRAAGRDVFGPKGARFLANVSDAQIVEIARRSGGCIWSGEDIDKLTLRGGLVFGIDKSQTRFEGNDRVFNIDHIVMGFSQNGEYHISQSSGGGKGVNVMTWKKWRSSMSDLFKTHRVQCVDLLATGNWSDAEAMAADDDIGDHSDFMTAAAG